MTQIIYDPYNGPIPEKSLKFYTELGRRFRAARTRLGLSLDEVAAAAGITGERLEKYENAELVFPIYEILPIMKYMNYPHELENLPVDD